MAAGPYHPNALKTEMNKVDVIVDGRPVAGMYQVVHHRIETISTTNAVVPRSVIEEQQVGINLISRKSRVGGRIVKSWKLFFVKCSSSKIIPFLLSWKNSGDMNHVNISVSEHLFFVSYKNEKHFLMLSRL